MEKKQTTEQAVGQAILLYSEIKRGLRDMTIEQVRGRFAAISKLPKPVLSGVLSRLGYSVKGSREELAQTLLDNLESIWTTHSQTRHISQGAGATKKGKAETAETMTTKKLEGRSARAARDLKELYDVAHESSVGVGAIDQMVEEIARLPAADVAAMAAEIGVKLPAKATRRAAVEAIKRALMEKKKPGSGGKAKSGRMSMEAVIGMAKELTGNLTHEGYEKVDFGKIEHLHDQVARMKPQEARDVAKALGLAVTAKASAPAVAREIRRIMSERKHSLMQGREIQAEEHKVRNLR